MKNSMLVAGPGLAQAAPALLAALIVGANAAAYENENAVPLMLGWKLARRWWSRSP